MPFSQKNLRFTTMVVGLVILCSVMLVCGVVISGNPSPSPTLYVSAYGFCCTVGMQLLTMIRTENGLSVTRHDIKSSLQPVVMNTETVVHKLENGNAPITRSDLTQVLAQMLPEMVRKTVIEVLDEREGHHA